METRVIKAQDFFDAHGYLFPMQKGYSNEAIPVNEFFTIGREPGNHLIVDDPFVSSRHARIERKSTGFTIRDMQSRNGTFLNGIRISEATLAVSDQIRVGDAVFLFGDSKENKLGLLSKNIKWNEQLARIPHVAKSNFAVLLTGPSGSGKEVIAQAVHKNSNRSQGPFVSINCGALSESLIESELFGHLRGSFTGAMADRKGAFEAARGGTLFLDEIGDLPISLQPKLLRALENQEIRPVGSDRNIKTDVRVIAATHKDLAAQVRLKEFREDLFYRLNVCQFRLPALQDRMEDFDSIAYTFAKEFRTRLSFGALQSMKTHSWPGNIRELKNFIAKLSLFFPGQNIQASDVAPLLEQSASEKVSANDSHGIESGIGTNGSLIKEIEREMIVRRLHANKGNQRATAKELGIAKSTLHDRLKTYSIDVTEFKK